MESFANNKIVVILGPTSSGKSDVAIKLAKKFDGEILSADSRQIYRGMNIGSGKEPGKWNQKKKAYVSGGVPHYGIDIVSPKTEYSAAKFKKYADKIILDILKRGKLPIICGGTGFWIKAVVDGISFPEVKPDPLLRKKLSKKTAGELFSQLKKIDPERAKTIDKNNPVRLIRAIEICKKLGKVPALSRHYNENKNLKIATRRFAPSATADNYYFLQIGIDIPKETLHQKIETRLEKRLRSGMIKEVEKLHFENNVSWKRLENFGLEYRWSSLFLRGKISREEMREGLLGEIKKYAKRQMTWFGKDDRISWLSTYEKIEKEIEKFLKNKQPKL